MKRIGLCYTKIKTLQIQLNTELAHRLDVLAISRGTTPEQIVLELLQQETALETPKPRPAWMGMATSGIPDLGSRARDYIRSTTFKHDVL
jgi:hypothetical protein